MPRETNWPNLFQIKLVSVGRAPEVSALILASPQPLPCLSGPRGGGRRSVLRCHHCSESAIGVVAPVLLSLPFLVMNHLPITLQLPITITWLVMTAYQLSDWKPIFFCPAMLEVELLLTIGDWLGGRKSQCPHLCLSGIELLQHGAEDWVWDGENASSHLLGWNWSPTLGAGSSQSTCLIRTSPLSCVGGVGVAYGS